MINYCFNVKKNKLLYMYTCIHTHIYMYTYISAYSHHYIKWEKQKSISSRIRSHTRFPAFSVPNIMLEVLARVS